MRESVGTTSTFNIVIVFTLLFAGFLSVAISYNRVFRVKNESMKIIEKYEGISGKSLGIINNYLKNSGYSGTGHCETGEFGVKSLQESAYEAAVSNREYYYCLSSVCKDSELCSVSSGYDQIYYTIRLFYRFDLPVIGRLVNFKISGQTKGIKLYDENQLLS